MVNRLMSSIRKSASTKGISDAFLLTILVVLKTIILFVLFDYPKSLTSYNDELIYFSMAKSIHQGGPLQIHATDFTFTYLGYPYVLSLAFAFTNTLTRIKAIVLINSLLCSSVSVPCYLISKELGLKKRHVWLIVIMSLVWSNSLFAGTFMAENLYFPLSLLAFYFMIKSFTKKSYIYAALAGFISYLAMYCKVVGKVIPIAFVCACFFYCVIEKTTKGETTKEEVVLLIKKNICYLLFFFLPMLIKGVYYFVNTMLFSLGIKEEGAQLVPASYAGAVNGYFASTTSIFIFFIYLLVYSFIAGLLAFLFFPIITPLFKYKELNKAQKFTYLMGIVLLLGTIFVVTLTAGIKEDYGLEIPRERLRYISAYIWLFIPVFIKTITDSSNFKNKKIKNIVYICFILLIIVLYRGYDSVNIAESYLLYYAHFFAKLFDNKAVIFFGIKIIKGIAILGGLLLLIIGASKRFNRKTIITLFFSIFIIINISSFIVGYKDIKSAYGVSNKKLEDIQSIEEYLTKNGDTNTNVLYLSHGAFDKQSDVFDTYLDAANKEYSVWEEDFERSIFEDVEEKKAVKDIDIVELHFRLKYSLDKIDYFIIPKDKEGVMILMDGVTRIDDIGGETYRLYKNNDPKYVKARVDSIH